MKQDYTHITVILDRSGSMESIRDDTTGGFNGFLAAHKAQPGQATLTLVQFDSQDPFEVIHGFMPIAEVPELTRETYVPRGGTPLLDALGRGINDLEQSLGKLAEDDRPAKVLFVVSTDGGENSSREFRKDQIEKMVTEKIAKSGWEFIYMTTDLAAYGEARALGIHADAALLYRKTGKGSSDAWASLSGRTVEYRSAEKRQIGFVQADRQHPDDPEKHKE